jgi:uncharacterized membrane protein YagU involved in acid resistance
MTDQNDHASDSRDRAGSSSVELPQATVWPIVVALGITMLGAGWATNLALALVGALLFVLGMAGWIRQLLPGRGHMHEPFVEQAQRRRPIAGSPGTVDELRPGMAGYRFHLPESFHPISSGVKGGIVGGLLMPIPALAYGVFSDHGIWFPVNLLAGIVVPGISGQNVEQLQKFQFTAFVLAVCIHIAFSLTFGLLFGVVSPTLPPIPGGPVIAGGVLMPLLWTGICHGFMGIINPSLQRHVNWFWFIVSQVVFGLAMSIVVVRSEKVYIPPAGSGPLPPPAFPGASQGGGHP